MYEQSLYKVVEPIRSNTIKRLNKKKAWKYGYNKEHDIVVISKTGMIGDVYTVKHIPTGWDRWYTLVGNR